MFLLTFVLIIISVLGAYAQVSALAAARFMASQTSLASTLVTWHATAANVAANAVKASTTGTAGCSLTATTSLSTQCQVGSGVSTSNSRAVATGTYVNTATGITASPPLNLANSVYQWNSVAFSPASGGYYILTYVTPSTNTQGTISTASSPVTQLNLTMSDVYRQLRQLGIPTYSYGYVSSSNTLNVAPITINGNITPISYPLPTGISIPPGSLGIISSPGRCGSC